MAKKSPQKTKKQICIDMLKRSKGASLKELQKATGWLPHSVRGFLSGTVKKMSGVALVTDIDGGGRRRYRIETKKSALIVGGHSKSAELEQEIGALAGLSRPDLIERWQELYRCDPPKGLSARILMSAVAYEM